MSCPLWHQLSEAIAPRTVKVFYRKYLFVVMDASSSWNPVCKRQGKPHCLQSVIHLSSLCILIWMVDRKYIISIVWKNRVVNENLSSHFQEKLINSTEETRIGKWGFRVHSPPTGVIGTYSIAVGEHTKGRHLAHFVLYLTFPNESVTMNGLSPWLSQFWGNVQN